MYMSHAVRQTSAPCISRTADFGGSRKARRRALVAAVPTIWHAGGILYANFYAHAACHAAHAHIEREQDRARPEPGLAAACSEGTGAHVHSMRAYACTLFCMTWDVVADIHAACHAARNMLAWDQSRP